MPDRDVLEDVNCPSCDSPLASIDWDANDDWRSRLSMSNVGCWVKWIALFWGIGLVAAVNDVYRAVERGASPFERGSLLVMIFLGFALFAVWSVIIGKAWWQMQTDRSGRLVTCLACGHRWRAP